MLVGEDINKVVKTLETATRDGDSEQISKLWRKEGPLGRLYNIIQYILWTPQRRAEFTAIRRGSDSVEFDGLQVL